MYLETLLPVLEEFCLLEVFQNCLLAHLIGNKLGMKVVKHSFDNESSQSHDFKLQRSTIQETQLRSMK